MKKAIFLDRDGTINPDIGYAFKVEDCNLIEDNIWSILKSFRNEWYLLIIITNQAWIDKWLYIKEDFFAFMKELESKLGISFDWTYFCPYHPKFSWEHNCRKPNNWMVLQACEDFEVDLENSYFVWDNFKDVTAWKKSGCKTILYNSNNFDIMEEEPDYVVNKWCEIEKIILNNKK